MFHLNLLLVNALQTNDSVVEEGFIRRHRALKHTNKVGTFLSRRLSVEGESQICECSPDHNWGGNPIDGLVLHHRNTQLNRRLVTIVNLAKRDGEPVVTHGYSRGLHNCPHVRDDVSRRERVVYRGRFPVCEDQVLKLRHLELLSDDLFLTGIDF